MVDFTNEPNNDWAVYFEGLTPDGLRIPLGVDNEGNTRGRLMSTVPSPFDDVAAVSVWDSVHEWWTNNIVNRVLTPSGPEDRGCGVSSSGKIVVWDAPKRGSLESREVGDAGLTGPGGDIDDHDAPSRWTAPDGSWGFVVWNNHGDTDYHSFKITSNGKVDGFNSPQIDLVVSPGAAISYQQLFLHSVNGSVYKFWNLMRTGTGWLVAEFLINPQTGTITLNGPLRRIFTIGNLQPYTHAVLVGRTLRMVCYVNPKENRHAIWLLSLNLDTGVLTSPMDSSLNRDTLTTGYTDLGSITPLVPETASTSKSRRMFESSPVADAVLYAEWDRATPDEAIYYVTSVVGGSVKTERVPVPPAGPRIGYTPGSNYIGGGSFSPSGKIATVHHDKFGGSTLRVWNGTEAKIVATSQRRMARPVWLNENEILVADIERYVDYFDFFIHQRSVRTWA